MYKLDKAEAEYRCQKLNEVEGETNAGYWKRLEAEASKIKPWLCDDKIEPEDDIVPYLDLDVFKVNLGTFKIQQSICSVFD